MKNFEKLKLILLFIFCIFMQSYAQDGAQQQSLVGYVADYMEYAGGRAVLFSGELQKGHPYAANHPYLKEKNYATGELSYNRVIYPKVQLRYDMSRDELIIQSPDFQNVVLASEHVDYVNLHNYHIIYFRKDSLPGCPPTGYYCVLHSGKHKILEKRISFLQQKSDPSGLEQVYSLSEAYYILKDAVYHRIRNKKALLATLGSHRKELKRFIRVHDLKFRRDSEKMIVDVVREYENLIASE